MTPQRTFLEFFAGGGMARVGLGPRWRCLFANDADPAKCASYRANFGDGDLVEKDVAAVSVAEIPGGRADLAWASFPCQDISLAGARAGLRGQRSAAFFAFWSLIKDLAREDRAPKTIVIENVPGLLTSNAGADFAVIVQLLAETGYRTSALVIDARHFVPQSRARLFIFGMGAQARPVFRERPQPDAFTPNALLAAVDDLAPSYAWSWRWLAARPETRRNADLCDIIDAAAPEWRADLGEKARAQMSERGRAALDAALDARETKIGAAFRRIRREGGERVQRLEARFDGLAGCLRTPAGGSSRQMLLLVDRGAVKARLLNAREAARLMGLPDDYRLPASETAALKLCGDGVAAPVVAWIAANIIEPAVGDEAVAA